MAPRAIPTLDMIVIPDDAIDSSSWHAVIETARTFVERAQRSATLRDALLPEDLEIVLAVDDYIRMVSNDGHEAWAASLEGMVAGSRSVVLRVRKGLELIGAGEYAELVHDLSFELLALETREVGAQSGYEPQTSQLHSFHVERLFQAFDDRFQALGAPYRVLRANAEWLLGQPFVRAASAAEVDAYFAELDVKAADARTEPSVAANTADTGHDQDPGRGPVERPGAGPWAEPGDDQSFEPLGGRPEPHPTPDETVPDELSVYFCAHVGTTFSHWIGDIPNCARDGEKLRGQMMETAMGPIAVLFDTTGVALFATDHIDRSIPLTHPYWMTAFDFSTRDHLLAEFDWPEDDASDARWA
ncbi:MAG: hypothetical protein ACFCUN_07060 [Hyphomicrobiaceae bacterium]